jgi:hypothetical protein
VIIALEMREAGVELGPDTIDIAIKLGRRRHRANAEHEVRMAMREELLSQRNEHVYYVRQGILVKIGTTIDLRTRFRNLRPTEILAIEPGGYDLEAERHAQFRDLKIPASASTSIGRCSPGAYCQPGRRVRATRPVATSSASG